MEVLETFLTLKTDLLSMIQKLRVGLYLNFDNRVVARSEYRGWGGQVVLGGDNVSALVEIGLTDLPKSGGPSLTPLTQ